MEWGGIKNGALLTLIEREGFQVFLTGDKNIVFDKFCLLGQFSSAEAFGVTMPGPRRFARIRRFVTDVRKTLEAWGRERFDYLVNNAGNSQLIHFDKVTEADFDAVVNVHFKGVYFVTQKLLPLINDGGRIVNISSGLTRVSVLGSSPWRKRHYHLLERRTLGDFTGCRQIVKVNGIQERLYRIRVQVTINDGRWRAGVPIFGHSAPEMRTDPPAVLNRIKHLKSEAQLP